MSCDTRLPVAARIAVVGLLLLHAGLVAWAATRHSPTLDEAAHLPSGVSHWLLGRFELYAVNPPLVRSVAALPVLACGPVLDWTSFQPDPDSRSEFDIGRDFIWANGTRVFFFYTVARWACIPFSLLGGWICFAWAREIYGWRSGVFALSLWCFSPTILANAQMITPDTGAAALGTTAFFVFRKWLLRPSWTDAAVGGVLLGLAQLTKFTWIIRFVLWPAIWFLTRDATNSRPWQARMQLVVTLAIAVCVVNVGYDFNGTFARLGDYRFVSNALGGDVHDGNRFTETILAGMPVPLPREYVLGIDVQKRDFERGYRSYLLGEWRDGGWWHYYLVALAVKVPLGVWLILVMAAALRLKDRSEAGAWREDMLLLAPALTVLVLVSSQSGFNHHMRYVLPMFPFVIIWISRIVVLVQGRPAARVALCGAWLWFAGSSLWHYPHSLSYFNELAGGPLRGHRVLVDSNIDWGQDLLYLKRWLDRHPEARPLGLAYFGGFDPLVAGIEYSLPPRGPTAPGDLLVSDPSALGPSPGWYAVSVSTLKGHYFSLPTGTGDRQYVGEPAFTYFQEFEPVARAGYSIYIYHLTADEVNVVRVRLGLEPLEGEGP